MAMGTSYNLDDEGTIIYKQNADYFELTCKFVNRN
jgi:hypothetical protein